MLTKVIVNCATGESTEVPLSDAEAAEVQARPIPPVLTADPNPVATNAPCTITATLPAGATDATVTFQQVAPTTGQAYTEPVTNGQATLDYVWDSPGGYTIRVSKQNGVYAEVQVTVQ